ncbi:hypothetical protein KAW50_06555 [candidate division WOR-3 bacterium]|nr:hypothetical protein [candidate division WOR-3 bacterium]
MPEIKEVSAKSPKLDRETVIMVNYGKDVDESVEMFGADAVNSNALANWIVTLQAGIRRAHTAGKTDDEIQSLLSDSKMGAAVSGGRIDPIQASLAKFKVMNEDERAAFLEQLKVAAAE